MATIKPIEGRSVHQIQSGQVIVDLQSVCKELVENSIDAGATSIEVRFKNNGLDAIEVQDNGSGIAPEDYETIALKHYTSKLASYDDLTSLQTFGFRGEALSSLCALSKFHIITARASDGSKGTKLEFEQSGKLKGTSVVAAKQGTTVVVETLFYNLPVRRKELEKTIKRQYNKVLELLNAYACISTGVKFSVSNQMPKGKKTIAFSTNSNPNTKENIANVYGTKTLLALIPLNLSFEMDPSNRPGLTHSARDWSMQDDSGSRSVKIIGHISRPVVGEGRQTPDRQMFFVNSRPCILPQVAKAFNEVYKSYNITQSPFIFADIKLDTNAYDVNVSPDKRTILLHDQTALLENLKDALVELFERHDQSVPQAQLLGKKLPTLSAFKPPSIQARESTDSFTEERSEPSRSASRNRIPQPSEERTLLSDDTEEPSRPGFIKASLIDRFAGRDAEERIVRPPPRKRKSISPEVDKIIEEETNNISVEPRDPIPKAADATDLLNRRSESPLFEPEEGVAPPQVLPSKVVQDFNARIAAEHAKQMQREQFSSSPGANANEEAEEREEPIPAIKQTSQKRSSQSTIQSAFDRMRPMRTPAQKATITVGDTTTISTIGSGSESRASKRARIHIPKYSLDGTLLNQTPKLPPFVRSLRGFSAPGTQGQGSDEEEEEEEISEIEDNPDSSMPYAPARSPSPHKHLPLQQKAFTEPSTDDIAGSSSFPVQLYPLPVEEDPELDTKPQGGNGGSDDEYMDESEKKAREEAKIAKMIAEAEETAARPTEMNLKRANKLFKISQKKYSTINLERIIDTNASSIAQYLQTLQASLSASEQEEAEENVRATITQLNKEDPEERLSLTVSKADFNAMRIIGQFNLGFILTIRPPTCTSPTSDLFIIDQHASDEKYNFERFSSSTVLVPQRLVHPHSLELTAVEEEIILSNSQALTANGFIVDMDLSGNQDVGHRAKLTSLPMSKEVTFTPRDLEELLALLMDNAPSEGIDTQYIPRPSKVRKLLASRACRSSVMIGKTLRNAQMDTIVKHMGSMDKPWSCPHGRPTMRHLYGLEKWEGWREGDGIAGLGEVVETRVDWKSYLRKNRR